MPYTYDDFINTATSSGNLSKFTTDDLDLAYSNPEYGMSMLSLMNDYSGAQTDEQRALINETQNQLRNSYRTKTTRAAQGNGYNSVYQPQIDDLTNKALTHGSFNFDLKNNPAWSTYKKNYLREGDRAAANALAAASNASAGRPSSYAITAAQQANDYWDTQLANIIPTLYNQSYAEWTDDFNKILTNLELLRGQDESEYARYLDQLNLDYQRERDAADDSQRNFANALSIYQLLGGGSPRWVLDALGLGGSGGAGGIGGEDTGSGSGRSGWYGDGSGGGTYYDEYGNTADDYQKVQNIFDRWQQGKFSASDATTIADTPQILELLMTDENGNTIGSVPTDAAERRRMANQMMLEFYGGWQDRGYLKDQYGNFIRDENGNPIPDGTGTPAQTWTADDQRQEQMMIRRMDAVEAGMDAATSQLWQEAKQIYQNGETSKDDLYGWLDNEFQKGNLSYADYNILMHRVSALPSDPSQIGNGGTAGTGAAGAGSGDDYLGGTGAAGFTLPNGQRYEPAAFTPDLLATAVREGNLAGYIRDLLTSRGVDTSIVPDDQIMSAVAAAANDVQKTDWQRKLDEQMEAGNLLDNMVLGRTTGGEKTQVPEEGRNLVEIIQDYLNGIRNVNGQAAVSDYEELATTPEGREANAAQMDAYRSFVPTGNAEKDAARLREIGNMGTGLYYDEASGTIKSVAPNVGDETGRVGEAIGNYGQILDNYIKDQSSLLTQSDPNGALVQTILGWVNNLRNGSQQQPASGRTPLEYSDAFLRQLDMQDAYSPYAEYNSQQPAQPGEGSGGNAYQNILDAAAAAKNVGSSIAGSLKNAANSVAAKIQQLTAGNTQTNTLPVSFTPSGNKAADTMNLQRIAAALPGYTYDPNEDYPGTAPGTGTIKPIQQTAQTGAVSGAANYSQILDNVQAAMRGAVQTAGNSTFDSIGSLVNKLTAKIQDVQAQQAAAQKAAEQSAAQQAAAQAARAAAVATGAGSGDDVIYQGSGKGPSKHSTTSHSSTSNDQYVSVSSLTPQQQLAAAMASVLPKPSASASSVVSKPSQSKKGSTR